jgi:hypothetical protein
MLNITRMEENTDGSGLTCLKERSKKRSGPGPSKGLWHSCCPLNCRGWYKGEERILSEALSEDAKKLLREVMALRREYPNGYVPDHILWEAAELDPVAYDDAAKELVANKLAEGHTSDPAVLRLRPKGTKLIGGI